MAEKKEPIQHFIQPTTSFRYRALDGDLLINASIIMAQGETSRVPKAIISRAGTTKVDLTLSATEYQAGFSSYSMGIQIIQADNTFWWVKLGSFTQTLTPITGLPAVTTVEKTLYTDTFTGGVISVDGVGYSLTFDKVLEKITVTKITGSNWAIPSSLSFVDGFVILSEKNSRFFRYSELNDTSFNNDLYIAGTAGDVDNIGNIAVANREVFVFGEKHTEVWYNTSPDANTVFTKQDGRVHAQGIFSMNTVVVNGVAYNACRGDTNFGVFAWSPSGSERISCGAVDQALESAFSAQMLYSFERNQLFIHCIIDGTDHWVWDHKSQVWSMREYPTQVVDSMRVDGDHYLIRTDGIYLIGGGTDDTAAITVTKQTSHIFDRGFRIFYRMAEFDFGGAPLDAVSLETSDDGGNTWRNITVGSVGVVGQYNRYRFHHLGYARDRVFRLRWITSDDRGTGLYQATLDFDVGAK